MLLTNFSKVVRFLLLYRSCWFEINFVNNDEVGIGLA